VKTDPEWAANVIQQYERTYAELVEGNKRLKEDYERLWETYQAACATIKNRESIIKAMDATFLGEGEE
jgi:N-dimethylarginine dimethylaminohydrolase